MLSSARLTISVMLAVLGLMVWPAAESPAQRLRAQGPRSAQIEAFLGEPFGVGRVELELPPSQRPELLELGGLMVRERNGRVFYPAVEGRPVAKVLKSIAEQTPRLGGRVGGILDGVAGITGMVGDVIDQSGRVTVHFLFRGNAPLELVVQSRKTDVIRVTPVADAAGYQRELALWWRFYGAEPGWFRLADYPPLVENYLKSMLSRRLGMPLPRVPREQSWQAMIAQSLGLGTDNETLRIAMARDRFVSADALHEKADQPLPEPIHAPELEVPDVPGNVAIEPLAQRVPAECFYVRFGLFSNFLWMQDLLDQWGGDFQNLVAERGLDRGLRERTERELVLKTNALARLLGDKIIADVAIIGTDFFEDGGAYGMLFHARSNALLQADFLSQRMERLARKDGVGETKVSIAGREVSFLFTPDGSVRSYYVADDGYHFVTTSKTLARRFLETQGGKGSLASLKAFRHARSVMPLERKDTVFVYLSDPFFRNYTSPAYRIETIRRFQALSDLELVQLAQLAAATEDRPGDTIEQLKAGGFLPRDFGVRPDGGQTLLLNGEVSDSLRGRRTAPQPIPDVPVTRVTATEAKEYGRFADFYVSQWGRLDPVLVGIQRKPLPGKQERIAIDLRFTPFDRRHYQILSQWFGPPEKTQLAAIANDALAWEIMLRERRLFGGLWDVGPPAQVVLDWTFPLSPLRSAVVGYLGTTGEAGPLLSLLNLAVRVPPDAEGYAPGEGGFWRRQIGPFTVFSLHRDLLATVTPQLRLVEAARPAQLRVRVADLSNVHAAPFANNLAYRRTRRTSLGNLRLMHALEQQLRVPGETCKAAAETLLNARLIDPLGGQYVYRQTPTGISYWTSTALEAAGGGDAAGAGPPLGYRAPPLHWFRGLDGDARFTLDSLSAHVEVLMQMPENVPAKPR